MHSCSWSNIQSRSCAGGGVIIYARDELEHICLELKQDRCASFFLSCLYRPPNTSAAFFEDLMQLVERISAEAKEAHFVGDFNIDLLLRNDSNSRRLKHLMEHFGLHQMIYQHVLPNNQKPFSITIIVHILNMLFVLLVPSFGLSDHNPTVLVCKYQKKCQTRLYFFSLLQKKLTPMLLPLTFKSAITEYPGAYSTPTVMIQMKC